MAENDEGILTTRKGLSLNALAALNCFLADAQGGVGPFLLIFLTAILHWRPERIGIVMGTSGVIGVLAQLTARALIDQVRHKRLIVGVAAGLIAVGSVGIALFPSFGVVVAGQSLIGVEGAVFGPAIAAITLGLVGRAALDRQIGRNQSINLTGNVANSLIVGLVSSSLGSNCIFFCVAALSIAMIASLMLIHDKVIDSTVAFGADAREETVSGSRGERRLNRHWRFVQQIYCRPRRAELRLKRRPFRHGCDFGRNTPVLLDLHSGNEVRCSL